MNTKLRICPLLLVAMFASCAPVRNERMSKNAFSEYEIPIDQEIIWSDCLNQKEANYLVFFYAETCGHCHEIMGDVLEFSRSDIIKTYFSDIKKGEEKLPISNNVDETLGITEINDFFIAGTPTVIEVYEGIVIANIPGKDECLTFLNDQRMNDKSNIIIA